MEKNIYKPNNSGTQKVVGNGTKGSSITVTKSTGKGK